MPCIKINKPLVNYIFTLRNDAYDNVINIQQNLSVFTHKKCDLKLPLVSYDKSAST